MATRHIYENEKEKTVNTHDELAAVKAKAAAEREYLNRGDVVSTQAIGGGLTNEYSSSPAEQAERDARYHADRALKAEMAAAFFRAYPAFDEFIKLIRSGAIGI